jgi:hypothetical protein
VPCASFGVLLGRGVRVDRQRSAGVGVAHQLGHDLDGVPAASIKLAAVWRVSCNLMRRTPTRLHNLSNFWLIGSGDKAAPSSRAKISPESVHPSPHRSLFQTDGSPMRPLSTTRWRGHRESAIAHATDGGSPEFDCRWLVTSATGQSPDAS